MDILDDMGVSKLSGYFYLKVNYSFKMCFGPSDNSHYYHIPVYTCILIGLFRPLYT